MFFVAMMNFPEVQTKAQAELDTVVGSHRLPVFEDRADLPYVNAIISEILRWQPATPVGTSAARHSKRSIDAILLSAIPHTNSTVDQYKGYFIPKGPLVIGNAW